MSYDPEKPTQRVAHSGPFLGPFSETLKVTIAFPEESEYTDQAYAKEADINTIMAKYQSTGEMPQLNVAMARYEDVTGHDFMEHMNLVTQAKEIFQALPSTLRERFNNDPARFLDFTSNPENKPEMHKLKLLRADYEPSTVEVDK